MAAVVVWVAEEDAAEEPEAVAEIDDAVYVIDWGRENWRLGLAPNKLEHLDELFIDQDGAIHRVMKIQKDEESKASVTGGSGEGSTG